MPKEEVPRETKRIADAVVHAAHERNTRPKLTPLSELCISPLMIVGDAGND